MKPNNNEKLKALMLNNNLSIQEVADKAGLNINTVKNVLYGRSNKQEYIVKIADAFEIPKDFFFEEEIKNYNAIILFNVTRLIFDCLIKKNIETFPKTYFDHLCTECYKLMYIKKYGDRELEMYINGQLDAALFQKLIERNYNLPK